MGLDGEGVAGEGVLRFTVGNGLTGNRRGGFFGVHELERESAFESGEPCKTMNQDIMEST